jgi:hypothetical protein
MTSGPILLFSSLDNFCHGEWRRNWSCFFRSSHSAYQLFYWPDILQYDINNLNVYSNDHPLYERLPDYSAASHVRRLKC